MIRRPPRSTLFPYTSSSDLLLAAAVPDGPLPSPRRARDGEELAARSLRPDRWAVRVQRRRDDQAHRRPRPLGVHVWAWGAREGVRRAEERARLRQRPLDALRCQQRVAVSQRAGVQSQPELPARHDGLPPRGLPQTAGALPPPAASHAPRPLAP